MARTMVAYCGIDCAKCPAYRYPRLGERLHLKRFYRWLLRRWLRAKGIEPAPGEVICDGCTTIDARCLKSCLNCPVRCCAMETGVDNCAHCDRFPCERLGSIWKRTVFHDAEPRLRRLRQSIGR